MAQRSVTYSIRVDDGKCQKEGEEIGRKTAVRKELRKLKESGKVDFNFSKRIGHSSSHYSEENSDQIEKDHVRGEGECVVSITTN